MFLARPVHSFRACSKVKNYDTSYTSVNLMFIREMAQLRCRRSSSKCRKTSLV